MKFRKFKTPPRQCEYLPERQAQMAHAEALELSPEIYLQLINERWRRFGYWLFRPECPDCNACQPIRVPVKEYKPNRIQRRIIKANSVLRLEVGKPIIDEARINLYVAHHDYHVETRGWHASDEASAVQGIMNFTISPLPVQEWAYYLGDELVAITYVDQLPDGFSGIYFYHSPEHRKYSLGNWICISMILRALQLGFDYIYFGYYVQGNISMEYKSAFRPNEVLQDGVWVPFLSI
jgi:arginyl-tRNA--protein-N-Asp/Glu arginylyltransferase